MRGDGRSGTLSLVAGKLTSARAEDETGPIALGAIFAIDRGRFEFQSGAPMGGGDLEGELDALLDTALRERDRLVETRSIIPSDRMRFRLSERAAEQQQIRVSSEEWRALLAIDGERDAIAIAKHLGIGRLTALEVLAKLVRSGFIDPFEPADAGVAAEEMPGAKTEAGEPIDLSGSVAAFPLDTVLELLVGLRKTGRVDVRSTSGDARIGITAGKLVSAAWDEETGALALGGAFTLTGGEFDFVPTEVGATDLSGEFEQLVTRAVEDRDRILAIRAAIPSETATYMLSDRATRQAEVTLTPEQWRTLLAVNGQRDVAAIAGHVGARRLATMMVLAELIQLGLVDPVGAAAPITEVPPPPPTWDEPVAPPVAAVAPETVTELAPEPPIAAEPEPAPPMWESAPPIPAAPADLSWAPPSEEVAPPAAEPAPPAEVDPRLAAFGFGAPAAPAEPARDEPAAEIPSEPAPAAEIDPRLAAFGFRAPAAPAEPAAPAWEPPRTEPAAAEPTWTAPVEPEVAPAPVAPPVDTAPAAAAAGSDLVIDMTGLGGETAAAPAVAPAAAPPTAEKKKGLFGGVFGKKEQTAAPAAAAPAAAAPAATAPVAGARTRAGSLAVLVNELLAAYNSGKYGKARVADRMLDLLMRVDEQADPIDRPVPVSNDRLDVAAIDSDAIPERQALPYLSTLVRQVYDDAERALGKDKAKKGFKDVRDRLFGKDLSLFQAPEVAGRMPKV